MNNDISSDQNVSFLSSITFKLLLVLTLLVTMLVFFTGYFLIRHGRNVLEKAVLESNMQIARSAEEQFHSKLKEAIRIAEYTAQMPDIQESNRFRLSTIMHTMIKKHGMIESAVIMDKSGKEISSSEFRLKYKDRSNDILFKKVMESRETCISPVTISEITRLPVFDIAVPIIQRWVGLQKPLGVLSIKIALKDFWPIAENLRWGKTGQVYVVDQDGRIIAHSYLEGRVRIARHENLKGMEQVKLGLSGKNGVERFLINNGSQEVISSYIPLRMIGGVVLCQQSVDEAFAGVYEMQRKSNVFLLVSIIIAIIISFFIARYATNPIHELFIGTRKVSQGDMKYQISVKKKDEIGKLAESFNKMTIALDKRIQDMNKLQTTSTKISSVLEKGELLQLVVRLFSEIAVSDKTSIMLLEKDGVTLKINASKNIEQKTIDGLFLEIGQGIAGSAAEKLKAIAVDDISEAKSYVVFPPDSKRNRPESLLSLPLIIKDKIIGVINISRLIPPSPFTEYDIVFFSTLANQAAVAIENAILYEMAITDGLTRLYIYRYFQQRLKEEVERARRYRTPLSFLMIDLDHFKKLNDTYGHQQGDIVLKNFADLIKANIRDTDVAARYGGEEFSIIIPGEDKAGVITFAERLRLIVEEFEFPAVKGHPVHATISIGVSTMENNAESSFVSMEEFIYKADKALYLAKEQGRNKVCFLSADTDKS